MLAKKQKKEQIKRLLKKKGDEDLTFFYIEKICLGEMGMGERDLMSFSPNLLTTKMVGYFEKVERNEQCAWARARLIAYYAIKGHDTKNKLKKPSSLFALKTDSINANPGKKTNKNGVLERAKIWAKIDEIEAKNGTERNNHTF